MMNFVNGHVQGEGAGMCKECVHFVFQDLSWVDLGIHEGEISLHIENANQFFVGFDSPENSTVNFEGQKRMCVCAHKWSRATAMHSQPLHCHK